MTRRERMERRWAAADSLAQRLAAETLELPNRTAGAVAHARAEQACPTKRAQQDAMRLVWGWRWKLRAAAQEGA
ncbi:MAG: hypothetical protein KGL39_42355 [Patescibacteria group bacterium]|nr:hypothetical protein [Patescibacteria group bacterium]